ncbi:MAG: hypothetical protein H6753_01600 [Candidatus Omnitrophica bacterium]|nr:hypothetical protein [Candidatus Omnitrophota bacterium]
MLGFRFFPGFNGRTLFFVICAGLMAYWVYLAFVTQPVLVNDAQGYYDLARMITQQGWLTYFTSGPNREPIYPFLVAFSMWLTAPESFLAVLKIFQIFLLGTTTFLVFAFLSRCGVSRWLACLAMVYIGLSPAMINTALSVYSEIAAHAFILGIAWWSSEVFYSLQRREDKNFFWSGFVWAVLFLLAILVKSAYEVISFLCLIPFGVLLWRAWQQKDVSGVRKAAAFLLTAIVVVQMGVGGYKYLNYKYNGLYVMTDRAAWALYGSAARRQQPLTPRGFGAAAAYNLFEDEGCRIFFSAQECRAWDVAASDKLAEEKNYQVSANFPRQQQNQELLRLSLAKILENPFQYVVLMAVDWVHLFFWESTRIGFVAYPDWLDKVYDQPILARGLRFLAGAASLTAWLCSGIVLWRRRKLLRDSRNQEDKIFVSILFVSYMILCHTLLHALFFTVPRFSLPIAALFIVLIALIVEVGFFRKVFNFKKGVEDAR